MSSNLLQSARASLAGVVQNVQRWWDRSAAQRSHMRARGEATREVTYLAALGSPVARERWQAAAGLGRSSQRSIEAVAALIHALGDEEQFVRWQAVEALARQEQNNVFHQLVAALDDDLPLRRSGAAEALGKLGGEGAALSLKKVASDPSPLVRAAVAEALGTLRDPTATKALLPLLHDHDEEVLRAAARALGRIGDPAAAPFLAESLAKPGQSVLARRAVAAALVRAGHPDTQPHLLVALRDEDPQVRAYAARALGHVGTEEAVGPLSRLADDKHKLIRGTVSERAARAIELLKRRGRAGHGGTAGHSAEEG